MMAAVAYLAPSNRWRPWLMPVGGFGQLVLVLVQVFPALTPLSLSSAEAGEWLMLDALGKVVLGYLSVLFFICSLYAPGYLALRADRDNRLFCANLFVSLATMTLVTLSH